MNFDDIIRIWDPHLHGMNIPPPVTTDSTGVTGVSYTYSTEPGFSVGYSQKDIDEAYCKGYNKALSERSEVPTGITTRLTNHGSVTLACGKCMKCNRLTSYADYCMWCGAKILLGGDKK